jgi:hypothetical protein
VAIVSSSIVAETNGIGFGDAVLLPKAGHAAERECLARRALTGSPVTRKHDPRWTKGPPGSQAAIDELARKSPVPLPSEYLLFLEHSNGGEGGLGVQPGWFVMWRAEEVLEQNRGYEIEADLPGFFGFGSSGGGELLAFDTRQGEPYSIVAIPFIPLDADEALLVASSFSQFQALLGCQTNEPES